MKVYFIGAGPGDPELLTIKAKKIIEKADIVIYAGSLINKDIIKLAKKDARLYDSSSMNLDEVLGVFKEHKHSDKIIARMHSGDPSIYGAIQEQMDWCEKERIAYEVIPGVSSFQAASASLRQELVLPGVSQTVILTRISGRTKVPVKEDLARLARIRATLVIFLSIDRIEDVVKKIKKSYGLNTPVAVIEKVSLPQERKITGTVRDIVKKVKMAGINRQALIIIGDVFKKNYQKSKLYAKDFGHMFRKRANSRGHFPSAQKGTFSVRAIREHPKGKCPL
ncbi:MAG: precorrin-4 C(11)-methyltransferase [Candidatus Omnitrophota bacterium]|nr:precorrin-4 C(11)-methyltransferase [Candidatus Omnitrophota bacterium]